jgi:hypothetical protein
MMIQEDFERDFLTDAIYLQEQVEELKAQIMEEINRNEAIIKVINDGNKQLPKVRDYNNERVYTGYDIPVEADQPGL